MFFVFSFVFFLISSSFIFTVHLAVSLFYLLLFMFSLLRVYSILDFLRTFRMFTSFSGRFFFYTVLSQSSASFSFRVYVYIYLFSSPSFQCSSSPLLSSTPITLMKWIICLYFFLLCSQNWYNSVKNIDEDENKRRTTRDWMRNRNVVTAEYRTLIDQSPRGWRMVEVDRSLW